MSEATDEVETWVHENAIRRLVAFYCDSVNHADAERAASVFASDGRLSILGAPELVGREAIARAMGETFSAYSFLHQVCHAGLVDVAGDRARARWSIYEVNGSPGEDVLNLFIGTYEDELVRRPEGWRFARRDLRATARSRIETAKLRVPAPEAHRFELLIRPAPGS